MNRIFVIFALIFGSFLTLTWVISQENQMEQEMAPKYLYKVISNENWKASEGQDLVQLGPEDKEFIHFSKEDQLQKIVTKYWGDIPDYVVLKIDTSKLPGKLVYEANPGGTNKYYHLYNGSIPLDSVVESKRN